MPGCGHASPDTQAGAVGSLLVLTVVMVAWRVIGSPVQYLLQTGARVAGLLHLAPPNTSFSVQPLTNSCWGLEAAHAPTHCQTHTSRRPVCFLDIVYVSRLLSVVFIVLLCMGLVDALGFPFSV